MDSNKLIYVADDDQHIRQIVKTFLSSDGQKVEEFATGDALYAQFKRKEADLVILDVMMPGSDGFTVLTELRKISTVPVIMLTARDSENDLAMGLGMGSDDYITKPFSAMALLMRVRSIFRRIDYESRKHYASAPKTVKMGRLVLEENSRHVTNDGVPMALSPTEYALMDYMMQRPGKAISREELLSQVWGFEQAVDTRATDDTIRRLRQKLSGTGVAIESVWGFGFRMTEAGDEH